MKQEAREALARSVNDLADALDQEYGADIGPDEPDPSVEKVEQVRDRLSMLLERDRVEAETVERHDIGARVRVKMKRGDSPRDEDEWVIEGSGRSAAEARAELDELIEEYTDRWADDVRTIDPWA